MTGYLLRRLLQSVVVLIGVTIITFILLHQFPGGPARASLGPRATPQQLAHFNQQYGLNQPLPVQYATWVDQLIHGNLGFSYKLNQSVASIIATYLPKTMLLVGISIALALVVAVLLGMLQAVRRNSVIDYFLTGLSFLFYSMPTFWLGILLIEILAVKAGVFPAEAPQGTFSQVLAQPAGLILPVITYSLVTVAAFSRYMRSAALDNLTQDYVRTARAKGVPELRILFRHVLRNSLIPVVTLLGLYLPLLFSGALVTESVFNYPGMGYMFWQAALTQDYPVLLGIIMVVGVATVAGSLLADILYAVLDPRVRYT